MSKDIIIQKNGTDVELSGVEKIRAKLDQSTDWVPENEIGKNVYVRGTMDDVMYKVTVDDDGVLVFDPEE